MPIRLRVQDIAKERSLTLGKFQREVGVSMSTARRVWYSTSDGSPQGPPLKQVSLDILEQIADYFKLPPGAFLEKVSPPVQGSHPG